MIIKGQDPSTGTIRFFHDVSIDESVIASINKKLFSDEEIRRRINNLAVSADVKSLLYGFVKATISVGDYVVKIGRKLLECVFKIIEEYPNATFGLIFGAIVGFLVSAIPILGIILGPLVTPITMGIGLVLGLNEDLKDKNLARKVEILRAEFKVFA